MIGAQAGMTEGDVKSEAILNPQKSPMNRNFKMPRGHKNLRALLKST
jgi:hypothetical protein